MTTFDSREKAFEEKYAHDKELVFRVKARAHKLLGLWAAGKQGLADGAAEAYAKALVMADFEHVGADDIIARLLKDFANLGLKVEEKDVRAQMAQAMREAQAQLAGAQ